MHHLGSASQADARFTSNRIRSEGTPCTSATSGASVKSGAREEFAPAAPIDTDDRAYRGAADGVGFEPTVGCPTLVFKTSAFDHSATHPDNVSDQSKGPVRISLSEQWPRLGPHPMRGLVARRSQTRLATIPTPSCRHHQGPKSTRMPNEREVPVQIGSDSDPNVGAFLARSRNRSLV